MIDSIILIDQSHYVKSAEIKGSPILKIVGYFKLQKNNSEMFWKNVTWTVKKTPEKNQSLEQCIKNLRNILIIPKIDLSYCIFLEYKRGIHFESILKIPFDEQHFKKAPLLIDILDNYGG